ncbi:MAG: hemolysin family protein [Acidimicrobiia bacterium]|nr:hemolysin family protein [Acidimicrobiia bacterium]
MSTIILLAILALCVTASGFLSGSETALIAIPRERVHQHEEKSRSGGYLARLTSDPERTLGTLLVANNFVNILGASVATALAIQLIANRFGTDAGSTWGPWASTLLFTALILIVGEITPKTLAARYPDQFSLAVARPIWLLTRSIGPITRLFVGIGRAILRIFGATDMWVSPITEEDIKAMAKLGEASGEIESAERAIIDSVFRLSDRPVREVMTPRVDLVPLTAPLTTENIRSAVVRTGHSRYPVVAEYGNLDQILGIFYVKDLLRSAADLPPHRLIRLLREPHYVPESTPVLDVFQQMRHRRLGFAVVLDEHGGVDGIVTIKDLVAELVGELQDEYDPVIPEAVPISNRIWLADGRMPVEDLADVISVELPEGPYATIGGLFLFLSGDIPEEGAVVQIDGVRFTVDRMDKLRIDRIRIEAGFEGP